MAPMQAGPRAISQSSTITFDVVGGGTSALDLNYSAMAATGTFNSLLPILTVNDGQVDVGGGPTQYTLTMAVSPAGGGTTSPAVGGHTYDDRNVVDITATPASGYEFSSWTGDVADANSASTTVTVDGNKTVTANFTLITPTDYTLTMAVSPAGGGTTTPAVGGHTYADGSVVNITATPASGYEFSSWTGDVADANSANTTVTVDGNKTVTANFTLITPTDYTLTMAVSPTGGGTTSPAVGGHTYADGSVVNITATPASGYEFSSWTGVVADANSASTTVTVDGNKTVTANFSELPPSGSVISSAVPSDATPGVGDQITVPINIDMSNVDPPNDALGSYTGTLDWNTAVLAYNSYSGAPPAGFTGNVNTGGVGSGHIAFNGANAGGATGDITVLMITFDVVGGGTSALDLEYSAMAAAGTFESLLPFLTITDGQVVATGDPIQYTLTMAVSPAGGGTTTPAVGGHTYDVGTVVDITATPASGYEFSSWTGDVADANSANTTVTVDGNKTVTANFTLITPTDYTLTMAVSPTGGGTTSPAVGGHTYADGSVVNITATPASGYEFSSWTGDVADANSANTTVTVNGNKTVTANFSELPPSGSVISSAVPSDATPGVGDQITVPINIDMSNVDSPNNALGSYTGTLDWNTAVLAYNSYSGAPPAGFTGNVNTAGVGSGHIAFNGANAGGATGDITVLMITFDVVGGGTSALDLEYSAMAAASTFEDLLPFLTITDGQVVATGDPIQYTLTMAVSPTGGGTTSPAVGGHTYADGSVVNITATSAAGYVFAYWEGDVANSSSASTTRDDG